MRICSKCSKPVDGEARICRACGGILAQVPDGQTPGPASPPVRRPKVPLLTAESPIAEPDDALPIVDAWLADGKVDSAKSAEVADWKCPQCGESVPGTFDVCWKCLTARGGETPDAEEVQFLRQLSGDIDDDSADAVTGEQPRVVGQEGVDKTPRAEPTCPRCGSSLMMRGVALRDQGERSDGRLKVVTPDHPLGFLFQAQPYGELQADICGACGHVELRVANPRELYEQYRNSREHDS